MLHAGTIARIKTASCRDWRSFNETHYESHSEVAMFDANMPVHRPKTKTEIYHAITQSPETLHTSAGRMDKVLLIKK